MGILSFGSMQHATYDTLAGVFFFKLGAVYLFGLLLIAFIKARNCKKKYKHGLHKQTEFWGIKRVACLFAFFCNFYLSFCMGLFFFFLL
ncbi:hypothetical protein FPQ18DRAFT_13730 [Pyronema domesticum]|nr:hypothetical protein FPQ18DRAFT_13730 [Pyronema domesticum]